MWRCGALLWILLLQACGGGGCGAQWGVGAVGQSLCQDAAPSALDVALGPAIAAYWSLGNRSSNLVLTGQYLSQGQTAPVTGTGVLLENWSSGFFEGQAASVGRVTLNASLVLDGQLDSLQDEYTLYLDAQKQPLARVSSEAYCTTVLSNAWPARAQAGQSGLWLRWRCYSAADRSLLLGETDLSYRLTADGANAYLLTIIEQFTGADGAGDPITTVYRLSPSGVLSRVRQQVTVNALGYTLPLTISSL